MDTLAIVKPQVVVIPPWIEELAEKTKKMGYEALYGRVQQAVGFFHGVALLNQIGVDVFEPKSVDRYKKIALLRLCFRSMWGWIAVASLLSGMARWAWCHPFTPNDGWVLLFGLLVIASACSIWRGLWVFADTGSRHDWSKGYLAHYKEPVPAFALQTAITIHEKIPGATLFVEELKRKAVVDPFLVVRIDSNYYHVAVWNEPSFKEYFV